MPGQYLMQAPAASKSSHHSTLCNLSYWERRNTKHTQIGKRINKYHNAFRKGIITAECNRTSSEFGLRGAIESRSSLVTVLRTRIRVNYAIEKGRVKSDLINFFERLRNFVSDESISRQLETAPHKRFVVPCVSGYNSLRSYWKLPLGHGMLIPRQILYEGSGEGRGSSSLEAERVGWPWFKGQLKCNHL
jgi:hypothetical protein